MITSNQIIEERKKQIHNELYDIAEEIQKHKAALERLEYLRTFRLAEFDMLDRHVDRGQFIAHSSRSTKRMHIEDAIRSIFDGAGKPLRIGDVIEQLERFGFLWSSYQSAYAAITNFDNVQFTGARGYYQYLR